MKNPFISKYKNIKEKNEEDNNYDINEDIKNKINNINKSYIDIYYESKFLSPSTTIIDKNFHIYILLIN